MFLDLDFHEHCAFGRVTLSLQGALWGGERLCFGQHGILETSGDGGAGPARKQFMFQKDRQEGDH